MNFERFLCCPPTVQAHMWSTILSPQFHYISSNEQKKIVEKWPPKRIISLRNWLEVFHYYAQLTYDILLRLLAQMQKMQIQNKDLFCVPADGYRAQRERITRIFIKGVGNKRVV